MSKIREKESLECGRMHIWALKTQKLWGPLSGPWTPAANCSLRSRDSTSLHRQLSASAPGAPPLTKSWIRTCSCALFCQWFLSFSFKHNTLCFSPNVFDDHMREIFMGHTIVLYWSFLAIISQYKIYWYRKFTISGGIFTCQIYLNLIILSYNPYNSSIYFQDKIQYVIKFEHTEKFYSKLMNNKK